MTKEKALVPITETHLALREIANLPAVFEKNFGSKKISVFNLERIKVGSGGVPAYVTVSEEGDEDTTKNLTGVVVLQRSWRSWWRTAIDEGGGRKSPPDCVSHDLLRGKGDNGSGPGVHDCRTCPNAEWGSERKSGRGQDCGERAALFLLRQGREDHIFPSLLLLPATSLRAWERHITSLTSRLLTYDSVVSEFSIEKATNEEGIDYGVASIRTLRRLEDAEKKNVERYSEALATPLADLSIDEVDVEASPEGRGEEPRTADERESAAAS